MQTTPFAVAALVSVHVMFGQAQAPAPAPALAKPAPPAPTVTVEGCVTRESASSPAAAVAREPNAAMQFVLTERTPPAPAVPDGSASSGATPMGGQKPGRKRYVLVAREGEGPDFAPHLNHMVRVTGTSTAPVTTAPLAGRSPEASPVTGTAAPVGATGTPFDTTNVPTLTVATLTMVASTCQ